MALTPSDQENRSRKRRDQKTPGERGEAVGRVEAVEGNRDHEGEPEDHVEDDGRPGALDREAEGVGLLGYAEFVEDAVGQRAGRAVPPGTT